MRGGGLGAVVLLAGCRQILGFDTPVLAPDGPADAMPGDDADAYVKPADSSTCYGASGWSLCFATPPVAEPVTLATLFNTNSDNRCQTPPWENAAQPDACMIVGSTITVCGTVSVTGTRPLLLLATDSITVSGTLDVTRAGGNQPTCSTAVQPFDSSDSVGGGGAGGTHQSRGGNAGNGATACDPMPTHELLRGGPRGQAGGSGLNGGGLHANPGVGGGAVYLVAGTSINITGAINASGTGGNGGIYYGGGGGGGAGGMIALYAPTIESIGVLMANGGGGGTQGTNDASTDGGSTPQISAPLAPAAGGMFSGRPPGGNGCARGVPATAGSGGAAGGGGCGFILANVTALPNASVSPGLTAF